MPLPNAMQAMLLTGFGGPERLQLAEVPCPTPAPGEVLIRVGACGVNNTDLNLRTGWYGAEDAPDKQTGWQRTAPQFPIIQGADIVGEIVAVGAGVPADRIGERVIVNPTLYRDDPENPIDVDFIGSERAGGFAEYVCVPTSNAIAIDSPLSDAELATFPTAWLTAWHMLARADVKAGETVLVTGASGGVGSALLQLVRVRGAQAVAIVGAGKEAQARSLGAVQVLARGADVQAVLGDTMIDVAADVVGGPMFAGLMQVVRPGGRIVTAGAIAGPLVEIDLRTLYLRHLTLIGSTLSTASEFAALVKAIETGAIRPLLAQTFPLAQLAEAQRVFAEKRFFGKLVIVP